MKVKNLMMLALFALMASCTKDESIPNAVKMETPTFTDAGYQRKVYLAKTLAKALTSPDVRSFLRKEALKTFDNDYDVLYALVRDKEVARKGTFEEVLSSYADSKEHFKKVIEEEPLLTIYVPELAKWDAIKWDTDKEVPIVAIRNEHREKESTKVLAFDKNETVSYLDYDIEPNVPVLVIKDNERILVNNESNNRLRSANEDEMNLYVTSTSKGELVFSSGVFKNDRRKATMRSGAVILPYRPYDDQYLQRGTFANALREMPLKASEETSESPRDYIYYGISTRRNITKGEFKGNAVNEHICAFYIENPHSLNYIADAERDNPTNWVEGRLEFYLDILFTGQDGKITDLRKIFTCKTSDLFGHNHKGEFVSYCYYFNDVNGIKIAPWDMQKYGDTWKIHIYEYDPGVQITRNVQVSSTFSSNFSVEAGATLFKVVKIGAKGGRSKSTTKTNTTQIVTTDTSDDLGEAILSFSDPIILKPYILWDLDVGIALYNGVSTGMVSIQISPRYSQSEMNY